MSALTSAVMVPHPPIILPNIGHGEEKKIADIDAAYQKAAEVILKENPDTIIIVSPHAPSYYDYIQLSSGKSASGDMGQFRDYADSFTIEYDQQLIKEIEKLAQEAGIPAGTLGRQDGRLDHGTMIPLYYLKDANPDTRYIRIGIGGPSNRMHYEFGQLLEKAGENLGRKIAIVASGDLSHCQKADSSYGFKECGPAYDQEIMKIMSDADFVSLVEMPEAKAEDAMVCGHKPFCILAGAMDGLKPEAKELAHSAVLGVGYGVVTYDNPKENPERKFLDRILEDEEKRYEEMITSEDCYVGLARAAVEEFVTHQNKLKAPLNLSEEMLENRAGVFVSIHKDGALRGCIGTTAPTQNSIAEEIIQNATSAASRDPRFPAIQPWELPDLEISVDVLKEPEPISSKNELDIHKYGVIVTKGRHRGLLLPDLDGVDSIDQQISIAKQKAGLDEDEPGCLMERFEVVRHH